MSEVEKKEVEQTTTPEATTGETQAEPKLSEESKNTGVDYAAKLEEERQRREKAEAKLVELKREKKEAKTDGEDTSSIDARIESVKAELQQDFDKKVRELALQSESRRYDDAISSLASNSDEAALMKHILENDIVPTGDIERDVRRAKMLANEDKIASESAELKQALVSRNTAGGIATGSQRMQEETPNWTAADRKFAAAAGLDLSKLGKRNK